MPKNTEMIETKETALQEQKKELVSNEKLLAVYDGILGTIDADREEVSEILNNFLNMVVNDGEGCSDSTKKAVVDLMKIKVETADKKAKIADLMTRIKLKEPDTFPKYMAAQQHNTYHFGPSKDEEDAKGMLLEEINKASQKKK
jgi:hypothetical protein